MLVVWTGQAGASRIGRPSEEGARGEKGVSVAPSKDSLRTLKMRRVHRGQGVWCAGECWSRIQMPGGAGQVNVLKALQPGPGRPVRSARD